MANSSKRKPKRTAGKARTRPARSRPLLKTRGFQRKTSRASRPLPPRQDLPLNPALAMVSLTNRLVCAYADLPYRLARCRSPLDVWTEQMRIAQLILMPPPPDRE
jgi:hypothetical protein